MECCGFFDANLVGEEYDRVYLSAEFAAYFASFIGNGVFAGLGEELQVVEMETPMMQVAVKSGQAFINGRWYENTENKYLPIDIADGVLNRIDIVVLRLGYAERDMWLEVKKGTPAVTPVAPELTRDADYYELMVGQIYVAASSIRVTQSSITDTRMNKEVCGWVTGVVDQIDTTALFLQIETYFAEFKQNNTDLFDSWSQEKRDGYEAWIASQMLDFNTWTGDKKIDWNKWFSENTTAYSAEFNEWFNNVKEQLSEDVAGHLQTISDEHEARLNNLEQMLAEEDVWFASEVSTGECLETSTGEIILFDWSVPQVCEKSK